MSTTLPTWPLWFYIPAALLAALGLVGLYCSLFKGRHKGRLRCHKCWYDMKGATLPTRCPECGTPANTLKDLQHTRRHWRSALIALLLIVPLGVVFARLHAKKTYYFLAPKWKLAEETRVNDTTISLYRTRDPDAVFVSERVTLRSNGKTLIDHEDKTISLGGYNHERETLIDLNMDGVKEAVIECYSGGAHCCYRVYIVELRPTGATIVADIDAQNGMSIEGLRTPDGEQLINIPDQTFAYYKASYYASPKPFVYYRLKDGALRLVLEAHDQPAFTAQEFEAVVRGTRTQMNIAGKSDEAAALLRLALIRLYGGHQDEAWNLIDRTWEAPTGKDEFIAEFKALLAKDPWYQDLLAARAARDAGKPIPPSIVGMSGKAADAPR